MECKDDRRMKISVKVQCVGGKAYSIKFMKFCTMKVREHCMKMMGKLCSW